MQNSHRGPLSPPLRRLCGHCGQCISFAFLDQNCKGAVLLLALVFDFSPDVSNIFEHRSKWPSDVPEKPSECKKHTNLCFTEARLMIVQGISGWLPPRWGPKEPHRGPDCAHRTAFFLEQIAFGSTKVPLVRSWATRSRFDAEISAIL